MSSNVDSRSLVRSVSTSSWLVSIGFRRMVASRTMPVRPMPPAVAQNRSGSWLGVIRCLPPAGVTMVMASTWLHQEPARWWFLPWMSLAIAPPTVTWRVPGVTGTNQPSGTSQRMRSSRLVPASAVTRPSSMSRWWMPLTPVVSMTCPPAFWAGSP